MYYREFETIIRKILDEDFEKNVLMETLKDVFDCEKIYDSNDKLLTDIFFTLKHYASGEEDIRKEEWQYFLDCMSGKREYNVEEKMCITQTIHTGDLYADFISRLGGKSLENGLFRSFSCENVGVWTKIVEEAYPDFKNMFRLFGFDWLGRCFGIDLRNETQGNVLLFEIGTGDVLQIPCTLEDFLNKEIPQNGDACLARSFFVQWQAYSKDTLEYENCIGYKIPLFLGGEDCLLNLEKSDMDVYWDVMAQVKRQVLR